MINTLKLPTNYAISYKVTVSSMVVIGILFGFVFNAPIQYFFNSIRIALVGLLFITILLTLKNDFKNKLYIKSYIFMYITLILGFISLNMTTMPYEVAIKSLYPNISILLGFFAFRYYEKFKKLLLYLIYVNLAIMILDVYSGEYLFNFDIINNYYQNYRGKGLFSYSKEAGAFMIFAALIFRTNKISLALILLGAVMSGSRSAMFFVLIIIVVELFYEFKKNLSLKKIYTISLLLLITALLLYIYFIDHPTIVGRLEGSFNFSNSGTHWYRFYIWEEYLKVINSFNILHTLFGNLSFVNNEIGNGAENAYLTVLSNGGLMLFLIIYTPMFFLVFLSTINFHKFYPFIFLLIIFQFGRQGLGWADGILLWAYIFYIYNNNNFKNILSRMIKRGSYEK